jgi:hypothetical protein
MRGSEKKKRAEKKERDENKDDSMMNSIERVKEA